MRCPSCNADNDNQAAKCSSCGAALSKKPRRRGTGQPEAPSPFAWPAEPANRPSAWAFWTACVALIPGLGLFLGPAAILMGLLARMRAKTEPERTAYAQALAAIIFGSLITVTNWLGLAFMIVGWPAGAP